MRKLTRARLVTFGAAVLALAGVWNLTGSAAGSARTAAVRSGSFVALQVLGGGRQLAVEAFSLSSGRPIARLAVEPGREDANVSTPHPARAGTLWVTQSTGPRCHVAGIECGSMIPDSCTSTVTALDPVRDRSSVVAAFPRSELVTDAVPGPGRGLTALLGGGCTTSYFNEHITVEDLGRHRAWSIGADARNCHSMSVPAWNAAGSKLVFAYGPSALRPGQHWPASGLGGQSCLAPRASGLVIVGAVRPSSARSWRFIAPRPGCRYTDGAFDHAGVVAFEACAPGQRGPSFADLLGPAFVVQLSPAGTVRFRIPLKLGANPGTVTSDPQTGVVLVSQDQTYRQHAPTYNWVWQLNGRRLRQIARYPFTGEGVFSAQPW